MQRRVLERDPLADRNAWRDGPGRSHHILGPAAKHPWALVVIRADTMHCHRLGERGCYREAWIE